MVDLEKETRSIAEYYINDCLARHGQRTNYVRPEHISDNHETMTMLAEKFESCNQLCRDVLGATQTSAHQAFEQRANGFLSPSRNWEWAEVITVFAIAGNFAVECRNSNIMFAPSSDEQVVHWLTDHLKKKEDWVNKLMLMKKTARKGWDTIQDYEEPRFIAEE